jgi:hypothetical protein
MYVNLRFSLKCAGRSECSVWLKQQQMGTAMTMTLYTTTTTTTTTTVQTKTKISPCTEHQCATEIHTASAQSNKTRRDCHRSGNHTLTNGAEEGKGECTDVDVDVASSAPASLTS